MKLGSCKHGVNYHRCSQCRDDEQGPKDIEGNLIKEGNIVAFSRNLWRGRDVLCRGRVTSVSNTMCKVFVLSPKPSEINLIGEDWNTEKSVKITKLLVIE